MLKEAILILCEEPKTKTDSRLEKLVETLKTQCMAKFPNLDVSAFYKKSPSSMSSNLKKLRLEKV